MAERAVVMFPGGVDTTAIEDFRRRFDPQAALIDAHVTLVFPFRSILSEAGLRRHLVSAVRGVAPFVAEFLPQGVPEGEYLVMTLAGGQDQCVALHDHLYTGPLARHLSRRHTYRPHVTVGRLVDPSTRAVALERMAAEITPCRAQMNEVAVFNVDAGQVDFIVPLTDG